MYFPSQLLSLPVGRNFRKLFDGSIHSQLWSDFQKEGIHSYLELHKPQGHSRTMQCKCGHIPCNCPSRRTTHSPYIRVCAYLGVVFNSSFLSKRRHFCRHCSPPTLSTFATFTALTALPTLVPLPTVLAMLLEMPRLVAYVTYITGGRRGSLPILVPLPGR